MTLPSTTIYVHPLWGSTAWSYAGAAMPSGVSSSAIVAVSFDASSSLGQQLARGEMQYSLDNGRTWIGYTAPLDGQGAYVSASGTTWRFLDHSTDGSTSNTFSAHYRLADGSVVTVENSVVPDNPPSSLTGENDTMFSTMAAGAVVDVLAPIDSGAMTGGRWVIDGQSQPGLFAIAYDPAVDTGARLVIADPAKLPPTGLGADVTIHYYDRYQLDTNGNPIAGQGVTRLLTYTVEDGATRDLAGFGSEFKLGAAVSGDGASPSLATLSGGGFVAVWQGIDTVGGGAGAGIWAQLRDAGGNALGAAFAVTPNGDAAHEAAPAVAALAGGRFLVAYSVLENGASRIAYRTVDANGSAGAEHVLDGGAGGDAATPSVATLADGSVAIAWKSGGAVHVQQAGADGAALGAQQVFAALSSAFSPSVAALKAGGYVVSWGEINDGNVYAATSSAPAPFVVSGDGAAASMATAAPLPHVAALASGGFVVAWDSYANEMLGFSMSDIFYQVYDGAGHATGPQGQANLESGGGRFDAAVTALADGGFAIAWQAQSGDYDGSGVFGRRFGADGTAIDGQEFEINQMRAGDQASPELVALANGGFAAAWVDTAAGGSSVAVEARVFLPAATDALTTAPVATAPVVATPVLTAPVVAAPVVAAPVVAAPVVAAPVVTTPIVTGPVATPPVSTSPPLVGTPGASATLLGTAGNNLLVVGAGTSALDGKEGLDTAHFDAASSACSITRTAGGFSVANHDTGASTVLANVERVEFSDKHVALDVDGAGGQAYRLYQAAFDRTPDAGGVGYWIALMDKGVTLQQAAAGFVASQEFADTYGASISDAQFVTALYRNVLHRPAEGAGFDFWVNALHAAPRAEVLAGFSESVENQAQVIGSIQNGFDYTPWA